MNISTIIGILASMSVFIAALFLSAKNWDVFLDVHAILVVIGGTTAASLMSFPLPKIVGLVRVFYRRMLGTNKKDYLALVAEIRLLSEASRTGRQAFAAAIEKVKDDFLKDAANIVLWKESDVPLDKIRYILELRAETHFERYSAESEIFRTIAKFPPAFGLMGTTLGMIALLQSLGSASGQSNIGPAMSVALVATLYGIVLANFVFLPIAENLAKQSDEDLICRKMVIEGVMAIEEQMPTVLVEETVKSFLLPSERGPKRAAGRAA